MNDHFTGGPIVWLAQATLLLVCFWAAYGVLKFHPRARVILCRTISVALLLLPLLTLVPVPPIMHIPVREMPNAIINLNVAAIVPTSTVESSRSTRDTLPVGDTVRSGPLHASSRLPVITLAEALMTLWLLGSALLLIRWVAALKMALRLVRSAQEPPEWAGEIQAEIASHLNLTTQVGLRVIDDAGSPLLLGPRPVILLPRQLLEEDAQDDFVPSLTHELVHVKEFDWWWSQWLHVVAAMLWPVPSIWFLRSAHDSSAEIVCDNIAASLVGGTELYAGTLARQSLHSLGRPRLACIPMLRRSGIRQRIDLLLSGFALPAFSRRSMVMTGLLALLACGVLSSIRVAAAGETPTITAPPSAATIVPAPTVNVPAPVLPSAPSAGKEIEPYGGISWNDGLLQVIQKIKKIDGITNITWASNARGVHSIDFTTIATSADLSAACEKRLSEYFLAVGGGPGPPNTRLYQSTFATYKDALGNDKKYVDANAIGREISAGPIILAGHPFTLHVYFGSYQGFAVQFPNETFNLPNYEYAVVPLAITSVELRTDTNYLTMREMRSSTN
jgi:beta-lactamase regulating signal transducer with metallopeptidase domain